MGLGGQYLVAIQAVADAIDALADTGNVYTRFRPVRDWAEVIEELRDPTSGTIRAWYVVPGVPALRSDVDAINGAYMDTYQIECFGMQGTQDDATGFADAFDRAADACEAIDALSGDYGAGGPTPFTFRPCEIRRHDFRYFGKVGVWWTEIVHRIEVPREVAVDW